jgi:hypothetical protein
MRILISLAYFRAPIPLKTGEPFLRGCHDYHFAPNEHRPFI